MQIQSEGAVAILGIGRMATGLAVDMALNGCPADVIDIKPRSPEDRQAKAAALQDDFLSAAKILGRDPTDLPAPVYCGDQIPDKSYLYVFEALPEEIPVKQAAYAAMGDTIADATALLATLAHRLDEDIARKTR